MEPPKNRSGNPNRIYSEIKELRAELKEEHKERAKWEKEVEKRLHTIEAGQILQDHKLTDLIGGTTWIRRTLSAALITGIVSVAVAVILWLIQK